MEKDRNTNETKTLMGLADCYGIEYFGIENELPAWLPLRAKLNRQRHALIFQVDMTEAQAEAVIARLNEGQYDLALEEVKRCEGVGIEQDMVPSWELIPNPSLDPYGPREFGRASTKSGAELAEQEPIAQPEQDSDSEE